MNRSLILVLGTAVLIASACKTKNGSSDTVTDEPEMAHGQYNIEEQTVTVSVLKRRSFNKQLICNGKLEAGNKVTMQFAVQGTVAEINVRDGQAVQKGQILASLDKSQPARLLEQARLSFDKAELSLADRLPDYGYTLKDTASIPADRKRNIYISSGFADALISLENAKRNFEECDLRAPFNGKIASVRARVHEPASQVCTLIDDSWYLVRFNVLETEYGYVRTGQRILVSPFVDSSIELEGTILSINPTVDQNGQIAVTARIPGNDAVMDGMNVRITIENRVDGQLVVPKSAVVIRDNMEVLFRYVDGRSLWTYVNVIMSNSTEHVVEANRDRGASLNVGDLIITSGNLNLGNDAPVALDYSSSQLE